MSEHNASGMPNQPPNTLMKSYDGGTLNMKFSEYTFTGSEITNDLVNIMELPAGAKFVPHLSYIDGNEATAQGTVEGFCTAGSLNGYRNLASTASEGSYEKVKVNTKLQCKLSAAPTAAKKVVFGIAYVEIT